MDWLWYVGLFFFAALTEICNAAYVYFTARGQRPGAVIFSGTTTVIRGLLVLAFVYDHWLLPIVATGDMLGTHLSITFFQKRSPRKNKITMVGSLPEKGSFPAQENRRLQEKENTECSHS